jgi:Family of unknown function (DUF6232)
MATLFRAEGLQVTEELIRSEPGTFAIADVRSVWVARKRIGRGSRLLTALLGIGAVLALVGGAGWLTEHWEYLLWAPVVFFAAAWIGLLDPIALYLEKRHHDLWIDTPAGAVPIWRHNSVEVNKALRAIGRARERLRERYEL